LRYSLRRVSIALALSRLHSSSAASTCSRLGAPQRRHALTSCCEMRSSCCEGGGGGRREGRREGEGVSVRVCAMDRWRVLQACSGWVNASGRRMERIGRRAYPRLVRVVVHEGKRTLQDGLRGFASALQQLTIAP
jgi:hypothetical protein